MIGAVHEVVPAARAAAAQGTTVLLDLGTGTRRHTLVVAEELFGPLEWVTTAEHTIVMEVLRRFISPGLVLADPVQDGVTFQEAGACSEQSAVPSRRRRLLTLIMMPAAMAEPELPGSPVSITVG